MSEIRPRYVAIKLDVVRSRQAKDRSALQARLFETTGRASERWKGELASRFIVTHGDEVQGMLHWDGRSALFPCIEAWVDGLLPYRVRFGVGVGELSTPVQPDAIGMDGAAWHRAYDAVQTAHNDRKHFAVLGMSHEVDQALTALANLLLNIRYGWTDKQANAVQHVVQSRTQAEAAKKLGITPATLSRHLSAANWDLYREGREAFTALLASV